MSEKLIIHPRQPGHGNHHEGKASEVRRLNESANQLYEFYYPDLTPFDIEDDIVIES